MTRLRRVAAAICLTLGVAGIVLGVLLAYASRVVFDTEAFSTRVSASLSHDGVATLVANRLADRVIQERRDLVAYRPVIVAAARSLVASPPFRAVAHRAARVSHRLLLSETGEQVSLTLQDAGAIVRSALATNPELERRIPGAMNAVVVRLKDAPGGVRFVEALRFTQRFRLAPWALIITGIGLAALGVALAAARRIAFLRVGLAIAAIAVAIRIAARFGGDGVALAVDDPLVARAVEGLWETFLGGLADWAMLLASFGLIVAAAVTSRLERVQLQSTGAALWRWFTEPGASLAVSLCRGFVLMTAGLLSVIWSEVALHVIVLSAGAVLFFIGLREFFGIGLRAIPDRAVPHGARRERRGTAWSQLVFVAGTAALLIAGGAVFLARWDPAGVSARPAIDACNGHAALCDRRLNEVVFGAAHNAMSAADQPGWMFPNHENGMPTQLQDGVRALLFDVHYGMPAGGRVKTILDDEPASRKKYEAVLGAEGIDAAMRIRDRLVGDEDGRRGVYLCHGFCELGATPFVAALRQIRDFLVVNPNEVLMIVIEDDGPLPRDVEASFRESGLINFVYRGPIGAPWPTLREMIASDQRVVVFAEHDSAGVSWYHQAYEFMQETPYKFKTPADFSCRANRGPATAPLFLVNHWIETAPAPKPSNAERVNAYDTLLARARACQRERHMLPNILAVDFYRGGDLMKVVDALNGL